MFNDARPRLIFDCLVEQFGVSLNWKSIGDNVMALARSKRNGRLRKRIGFSLTGIVADRLGFCRNALRSRGVVTNRQGTLRVGNRADELQLAIRKRRRNVQHFGSTECNRRLLLDYAHTHNAFH